MTKGFFTSEFWLNLGSFSGGMFLLIYGAISHDRELVSWGVALAAGVSVPYAGIRAFVKVRANDMSNEVSKLTEAVKAQTEQANG